MSSVTDMSHDWDGYIRLCYALISSALKVLQERPKPTLAEDMTAEGLARWYKLKYPKEALVYADAYYFIKTRLFDVMCEVCELDADRLRERIQPKVEREVVEVGEAYLSSEKVRLIELQLPQGRVGVKVPLKWRTGAI